MDFYRETDARQARAMAPTAGAPRGRTSLPGSGVPAWFRNRLF